MNLLAFDTSTEALSVAVASHGTTLVQHGEGGARSSSTLIPTLLALLQEAGLALRDLDAIVFGSGPGSFTGLRTACSVAQGLAFGAGVSVLPVETLMAVADEACRQADVRDVLALLDARMDEVYMARYVHDGRRWHRDGPVQLAAPEAVSVREGAAMAGNVFPAYGERLPRAAGRIEALPTAGALLRLAPALLADGEGRPADQALPLYVRDKVAQTTAERAAARQDRMAP